MNWAVWGIVAFLMWTHRGGGGGALGADGRRPRHSSATSPRSLDCQLCIAVCEETATMVTDLRADIEVRLPGGVQFLSYWETDSSFSEIYDTVCKRLGQRKFFIDKTGHLRAILDGGPDSADLTAKVVAQCTRLLEANEDPFFDALEDWLTNSKSYHDPVVIPMNASQCTDKVCVAALKVCPKHDPDKVEL